MQRRQLLASGLVASVAAAGVLPALLSSAPSAGGVEPAFVGIDSWLNLDQPADLESLRGKVTLVNFWTYSCINVLRTLPYLRRWHEEYGVAGLQIVGVHTPEFHFEHLRPNVEIAVRELGIRYAVGQDNGYRTWRGYNNRAWPAFYLLDRNGRIVLLREGEGHAVEMERAIRGLLGLAPRTTPRDPPDDADLSRIRTPEMYFGGLRPTPQEPAQSPRRGGATYAFSQAGPRLNRYELEGHWVREDEALILRSDRGRVRLRFSAAKIHVVAAATHATSLRVMADAGAPKSIQIGRPTLYTLVDGSNYDEHLLEIEAVSPGFSLYSATFG